MVSELESFLIVLVVEVLPSLDSDAWLVDAPSLLSVVSAFFLVSSGFCGGFLSLKSVAYQPVPLSLNDAEVTSFRNFICLHSGQIVNRSSESFCMISNL